MGPTRRVCAEYAVRTGDSPDRLTVMRGREIHIETEPSRPVSVDGEILTKTPIDCTVAGQALQVMVPKGRDDLD